MIKSSEQKSSGIRTYVVRSGRMSEAKKETLRDLYPRHGIDPSSTPKWDKLFTKASSINIEIGFGAGESLLHFADQDKEVGHIGFEVYPIGVASVLKKIDDLKITNCKVVKFDALLVLDRWFTPGQLSSLRVFFPDPWPRSRHRKRRLVSLSFMDKAAKLLNSNGCFHMASDCFEYIDHVHKLIKQDPKFEFVSFEVSANKKARFGRPITKFENRASRDNRNSWDLVATKKA